MTELKWLSAAQVKMLHAESIRLFGGLDGIRDVGLLESAVDRPRNTHAYEPDAPIFNLGASLGFGIARNHPFLDGNKRTALLAMRAFLFMNGWHLRPDEAETVAMIESLASGSVTEIQLADWLEANSEGR